MSPTSSSRTTAGRSGLALDDGFQFVWEVKHKVLSEPRRYLD
jgi:hypothetical protein